MGDTTTPYAVPTHVVKRDGRIVDFDKNRIYGAIKKCFDSLPDTARRSDPSDITKRVVRALKARNQASPRVEDIQDMVELVLQTSGEYEAAKKYILYRNERAKLREDRPIPAEVSQIFRDSDRYFPTDLQKFQYFDKYARFNHENGRRETWVETVDRTVSFLRELSHERLAPSDYDEIREGILRSLMARDGWQL